MTPFNARFKLVFVAIVLSSFLSACGGGDSSSSETTAPLVSAPGGGSSSAEKPPAETVAPEKKLWVEGYAVKGAIDGGLVSLWGRESATVGLGWVQVGGAVRTDQNGGFRVEVPEGYSSRALKVVLESDTQTLMRCDARPSCKTPSGVSVAFGEWFWPGSDLVLKSLVDPSGANRAVALTPLATLVFEKFLKSPEGGFTRFKELLGEQEERFGLDAGALSRKPVDLAAADLNNMQVSDLKTSLLNVAFLSMVDGKRWHTLGDVLETARVSSEETGDLPLSVGDTLNLSVELLALAGMLQAESSQALLKGSDVEGRALTDAIAGFHETLVSIGPINTPEPDESQAEAEALAKAEAEAQAKAKAKAEALAKAKAEAEALAQAKAEEEALAKARAEAEALAQAKAEEEALAQAKAEAEALAQAKAEALAKEKAEAEALAQAKAEAEALAQAKAEAEAKAEEEAQALIKGSARLSWLAPGTRVNGDSLDMGDIKGYIVRYGTQEDVAGMANEVIIDGQEMELEVSGLGEGTWYFSIRTVDWSDLQSEWSSVVSKTIVL